MTLSRREDEDLKELVEFIHRIEAPARKKVIREFVLRKIKEPIIIIVFTEKKARNRRLFKYYIENFLGGKLAPRVVATRYFNEAKLFCEKIIKKGEGAYAFVAFPISVIELEKLYDRINEATYK